MNDVSFSVIYWLENNCVVFIVVLYDSDIV